MRLGKTGSPFTKSISAAYTLPHPHHKTMRLPHMLALLSAMLTFSGCRARLPVADGPLPPNTIPLSAMMRELSAQPGFTETLLAQLDGAKTKGKKGPALLTPELLDELRKRILGRDWEGLDRFPGWTMREIDPTVRAADRLFRNRFSETASQTKRSRAEQSTPPQADKPPAEQLASEFLDLGPYPLTADRVVSLDIPSDLPDFSTEGIVTPLGDGVVRGDGPNALAAEHAASARLAYVLNRLSVNTLPGARPFTAMVGNASAHTPEQLLTALLSTGHTVTVHDARYFANFGHLHFRGQDVMMPFWVNTELAVPGTGGLFRRARPLLVPVTHAEYEWQVRGPVVNADVSHYFGVDGKAEFRTMDTLDQTWVGRRFAHTYTGPQALEVTRLTGLLTLAYMHLHAARPALPFGGYYTLGVCQDPVSAIEFRMTGHSTLFPNTVDAQYFSDRRDREINALMHRITTDRRGAPPEPARVFGSLPANPGSAADFATIAVPGLANDLAATYRAWQNGTLEHTHSQLSYQATLAAVAGLAALLVGCWLYLRKRPTEDSE